MHTKARTVRDGRPVWVGDWAPVWDAVMRGQEPAESLPSALRAALFRTLRAEGATDYEVAAWTRTTVTVVWRQVGRSPRVHAPASGRRTPLSTAMHRAPDDVRSRT